LEHVHKSIEPVPVASIITGRLHRGYWQQAFAADVHSLMEMGLTRPCSEFPVRVFALDDDWHKRPWMSFFGSRYSQFCL
jgi:hypothetical protein